MIDNQEVQIQQLQVQLASIRHHALEAAHKPPPAVGLGVGVPGVGLPLPVPGPSPSSGIVTALYGIVERYPLPVVLLVWFLGILSLLLLLTAVIAYMYILLLSLFCGVRVVPGVDPGSYISASPSKLWAGVLTACCGANTFRWLMGAGDSNSGYLFTPKKKAVYTV